MTRLTPRELTFSKHTAISSPAIDDDLAARMTSRNSGLFLYENENENENEKSTFPIHTPIIIHTSVYMSEVVVLGPRSAAFGAKSLSPLLF